MPAIYLQEPLTSEETQALRKEFPHYTLLNSCEGEEWRQVEILYGNQLSEKELKEAPRLRWIHAPTTDLEGLCYEEVLKKENILITLSKGDHAVQTAEFVLGAVLAFAKQLFQWKALSSQPEALWNSSLHHSQWSLQDKTLLQVGLGEVGSAVVKLAQFLGMRTWGVRRNPTFHPHCDKVYHIETLNSLLPACDVVVLSLTKGAAKKILFSANEFNHMKDEAIFIVTESAEAIDEEALAQSAEKGKFRGILLDAFRQSPLPADSPLWKLPQAILTPSISHFPPSKTHVPFILFRRNFRLFANGRFKEMKNLVSGK